MVLFVSGDQWHKYSLCCVFCCVIQIVRDTKHVLLRSRDHTNFGTGNSQNQSLEKRMRRIIQRTHLKAPPEKNYVLKNLDFFFQIDLYFIFLLCFDICF